jgi:hypothetical protein
MKRAPGKRASWAVPLMALGGCTGRLRPAPDVAFAGCAQVFRGPSCALAADTELTVFTASTAVAPAFAAAGHDLAATCRMVRGGQQCRVRVPQGARRLRASFGRGIRPWTLTLQPPASAPRATELEARLLSADKIDAELEAASATCSAPLECARLAGLSARLAARQGRTQAAQAELEAALRQGLAAGCISCAGRDGMALAYALIYRNHDLAGAKALLARLAPALADDPSSRLQLAYYGGALARESGDWRAAMRLLSDSEEQAERLNVRDYLRVSRTLRALVLQALGRNAEALHELEAVAAELGDEVEPCERAVVYHDLGWAALLAYDAGVTDPPGLLDLAVTNLERALALHAGACQRPSDRASAELDRAFAALLASDLVEAQRRLDASAEGPAHRELWLEVWRLDLNGRLALARGDGRTALERFMALERLGTSAGRLEAVWRARIGEGRSLAALGRTLDAIAAYDKADALSSKLLERIALEDGRADFVSAQARALEEHLELVVAAHEPARAMALVARAHRRALVAVSRGYRVESLAPKARARWEASIARYHQVRQQAEELTATRWQVPRDGLALLDERLTKLRQAMDHELDTAMLELPRDTEGVALPELSAGELALAYFFGPTRRFGFARTNDGVRAVRLARGRPDAQPGEEILEPFSDLVSRTTRIRVSISGRAANLALHALSWHGKPLVSHAAVAYSADLGAWRSEAPAAGRALLVADPRGDLAEAREEGADVWRAWAAKPWLSAAELLGARATSAAVTAKLAHCDLFHYAGHGRFAGAGGWSSHLALAARASLDVGQVLALAAVPRLVVLAACEGGRQKDRQVAESLSIANAFLAAGSRVVVAADRPVGDDTSRRLSSRFYAHLKGFDAWQVAEALQEAQVELLHSDPAADWAAFRVLTR